MEEELKHLPPRLLAGEKKCLEKIIPSLRGYYLLVLSAHRKLEDLPSHRLHSVGLSPHAVKNTSHSWIQSSYEAQPIRDSSIDAAILPYTLEFSENATPVLQEIHRILIGEGKLLLFGFERLHPWCWIHAPKSKNALSFWKMKKLLEEAGFSIETTQHFHYGAIYFIIAQKHISLMTPLRVQWKKANDLKGIFAGADTQSISRCDEARAQPRSGMYKSVHEHRGKLATKSQLERRRVDTRNYRGVHVTSRH